VRRLISMVGVGQPTMLINRLTVGGTAA